MRREKIERQAATRKDLDYSLKLKMKKRVREREGGGGGGRERKKTGREGGKEIVFSSLQSWHLPSQAREEQEELAMDMQILDTMLKETTNEAMQHLQRKVKSVCQRTDHMERENLHSLMLPLSKHRNTSHIFIA